MVKRSFIQSNGSQRIFGESITGKSAAPRRLPSVQTPRWLLPFCLLLVFGLLAVFRLIDLQIVRGSYFRGLADGNRIRRIPIRAPRGQILDRSEQALAQNTPVYKLATFSSGGVVTEAQEISREEALRTQASDPELAARLLVDVKREYPLGEAAAHVVGYVGEATREEVVGMINDQCSMIKYQLGDVVGRMGVEAQYDCILRGVNGEELIEVDTRGRLIRRLGRREPIAGKTIKLTIDSDLQKTSHEALGQVPILSLTVGGVKWDSNNTVRGAFVAQSPEDGSILALVSVPSFNPSTIGEDYNRLVGDSSLPLFNRAIGGVYPPGSTFKVVTAAAGLETGVVERDFAYIDTGAVTVGDFSYKNWYFTQYGRTEGEIDIVRAITRSTDTFFYEVGGRVGVEPLARWAKKFGLGSPSSIDLPGEVGGLVPDPKWKKKVKGERWFLGNTYHLSIGQGDITATPLQVNTMTSVVASGGKLCRPHVVNDQFSPNESYLASARSDRTGQAIFNFQCEDIGLKEETVKIVTEGMIGACSPGGTAFPLFDFQPKVGCKTGTAQTIGERTHAWLTAFAPASVLADSGEAKPNIVVTALVEEGGEGSRVAAPVVRKVLEEWFGRQ